MGESKLNSNILCYCVRLTPPCYFNDISCYRSPLVSYCNGQLQERNWMLQLISMTFLPNNSILGKNVHDTKLLL